MGSSGTIGVVRHVLEVRGLSFGLDEFSLISSLLFFLKKILVLLCRLQT